ncbi:hypothetical protein GGI42DRAFT_321839 [Trichoderma sp. SZMC 28013]
MRRLILEHKYNHTVASRTAFFEHPLCRDPAGTTRPGLILLRALYKAVPVDFQNDVVARCGRLPMRNRSDEYFALFPDTVSPQVFDMDTDRARRYQERYPLLKVTPSTYRNRQEVVVPAPQETLSPRFRQQFSLCRRLHFCHPQKLTGRKSLRLRRLTRSQIHFPKDPPGMKFSVNRFPD